MPWTDLVLRSSEILIETCSARLKILAVKLARSLEAPLGLNYRGWRSSSSMLETRSARSKILACKLARSIVRSVSTLMCRPIKGGEFFQS